MTPLSPTLPSSELDPVAHRPRRCRPGAGIFLRADVGGDGGEIAGGDLPGIAAPAIDQQLDAASVAGSDCARKVRLDIERRDDLALVDKAPQLLAVGHAMHLGDEVGPIEPCHQRSEEHTSELQSLMRISYAVFCLKKKTKTQDTYDTTS